MKNGFPRWIGWTLGFVIALAVAACGGDHTKRVVIAPEFQPQYAVLFDDVLAPELFGFDPEGRDPTKDPKLRERALRSDLVLPVRVETISRTGGVEKKGAYELVLRASGPALFGKDPGEPLLVNIGAGSPSYAWVEGAGAHWVGTRLIVLAKRFKGASPGKGDVIHYRGEPDTQAMREAINRHLASRVLRSK